MFLHPHGSLQKNPKIGTEFDPKNGYSLLKSETAKTVRRGELQLPSKTC